MTRPSLGTVLGALALFVALGGPAQAAKLLTGKEIKNNSVTSKDLRNRTIHARDVRRNTLGGDQVNESSLGTVPRAAAADQAVRANDAATLGGTPASGFLAAGALALSAVTEPELDNNWAVAPNSASPGYFVDPSGLVHLLGAAQDGVDNVIFTLPDELAPAFTKELPAVCDEGNGPVRISPSGSVEVFGLGVGVECDQFVSLEAVVFRPGT